MNRNKVLTSLFGVLAVTVLSTLAQAASVTVNTTADVIDTPECTLREAIQSVNQDSVIGGCTSTGTGTIDTVELPAGAYVLSLTGTEDNNGTGDLDVLANLTLNGAGADTTSISAQGLEDNGVPGRVLHINPFGDPLTVTLNGVTVRDGLEQDDDAGGILIEGQQVTLAPAPIVGAGTGVNATLNDLIVTDNESDGDGGGIAIFDASTTINNTIVSNNISNSDGGGIAQSSRVEATDLELNNSTIQGNTGILGAGISTSGGLVMDSSTVSNNTNACAAGGIFIEGLATITNSTVSGNRADNDECGIAAGAGDLRLGGGLAIDEGSGVTIINSTISGNFAVDGGGGLAIAVPPPIPGIKLGVIALEGVHFFNVTIADNETDGSGGGIFTLSLGTTGAVSDFLSMANSILANNTAGDSPDCFADFLSEGYNLVEDTAGCNGFTGTGDQTGIDPQLGPLQDNGGPTFTQALLVGSPAIDTANPSGCLDNNGTVLNSDQRGETRPVAILDPNTPICDIGAFEFQIPEPTPSPTPTATPNGFLISGTGCALVEGTAPAAAPALLVLLAGLGALAYRYRRAE